MREVERGIGDRCRFVEIDPGLARDPHRPGRHRLALVGELQRHRARARDEQVRRFRRVEGGERGRIGGFDREEANAVDQDRPAAAERVGSARGSAGLGAAAGQISNSVTSGT
jgi:hypothetical protein